MQTAGKYIIRNRCAPDSVKKMSDKYSMKFRKSKKLLKLKDDTFGVLFFG